MSHSFIYRKKFSVCGEFICSVSVYCFKWLHKKRFIFSSRAMCSCFFWWLPESDTIQQFKQVVIFICVNVSFLLGWIMLSFQSNGWTVCACVCLSCGVRLDFGFISLFYRTWFWHWAYHHHHHRPIFWDMTIFYHSVVCYFRLISLILPPFRPKGFRSFSTAKIQCAKLDDLWCIWFRNGLKSWYLTKQYH